MAKWWKWKIHWKLNLWPWSLQLPLWQRCDRWLPDRMPLVGRKCLIIYTHFCSFVLRDLRQKWMMIISVKTKTWKQKQHTWSKPVIMHNFLFLYHNDIKPKPKRKNRRAYLKQTCDDSQLFLGFIWLCISTCLTWQQHKIPVSGFYFCSSQPAFLSKYWLYLSVDIKDAFTLRCGEDATCVEVVHQISLQVVDGFLLFFYPCHLPQDVQHTLMYEAEQP